MRRKDKEIVKNEALLKIIDQCSICRIAMEDKEGLYLVPMNFGYEYKNDQLILFFHSAKHGRKISALKENPEVCFEMDCGHGLITGDLPCQYSYSFNSIIGTGNVIFIEDDKEKKTALSALMDHYTKNEFTFDSRMADTVSIFKIIVHNFSGKAQC